MLGSGSAFWSPSVVFLCTIGAVLAQQPVAFQWGPPILQTQLQECGTLNVQIFPLQLDVPSSLAAPPGLGTPPYYMFAYEPGGPTTSANIGSDPSNLTWTVDHAAGNTIILQVADAMGNTGSVGPTSYIVNPGASTSCHSRVESSPVILTTPTTQLTTCQPLVLDIEGGEKPYTITIAALNGHSVTNVTLPPDDNRYTWINRAAPGSGLIAVAHDATGTYSQTTNLIGLSGSTDTTCVDEDDSSGVQSAAISSSATAASSKTHSVLPVVAGVSVAAVVIGCTVAAFAIVYCRSRRQRGHTDPFTYAYKPEKRISERRGWSESRGSRKDIPGFTSPPLPKPPATRARGMSDTRVRKARDNSNHVGMYGNVPPRSATLRSPGSSFGNMNHDLSPVDRSFSYDSTQYNRSAQESFPPGLSVDTFVIAEASASSSDSTARTERERQLHRLLSAASMARRQKTVAIDHGFTETPPRDQYSSPAPPAYPGLRESRGSIGKS